METTKNEKRLINEISDLPAEQRANIVDSILQTLHKPDPEVEKAWAEEARRRLDEIKNGEVETIPGEQVMKELREKYG